jgi:hypothetical protein
MQGRWDTVALRSSQPLKGKHLRGYEVESLSLVGSKVRKQKNRTRDLGEQFSGARFSTTIEV